VTRLRRASRAYNIGARAAAGHEGPAWPGELHGCPTFSRAKEMRDFDASASRMPAFGPSSNCSVGSPAASARIDPGSELVSSLPHYEMRLDTYEGFSK